MTEDTGMALRGPLVLINGAPALETSKNLATAQTQAATLVPPHETDCLPTLQSLFSVHSARVGILPRQKLHLCQDGFSQKKRFFFHHLAKTSQPCIQHIYIDIVIYIAALLCAIHLQKNTAQHNRTLNF